MKSWLSHPMRSLYWRWHLRSNMKLTVDINKSLPVSTELKMWQERIIAEYMATRRNWATPHPSNTKQETE